LGRKKKGVIRECPADGSENGAKSIHTRGRKSFGKCGTRSASKFGC